MAKITRKESIKNIENTERTPRIAKLASIGFTALYLTVGTASTSEIKTQPTATIEHIALDPLKESSAEFYLPHQRHVIFPETGFDKTEWFASNYYDTLIEYGAIDVVHLNKEHSDPQRIARMLAERYTDATTTPDNPMHLYFYGSSAGGNMAYLSAQYLKNHTPHIKVEMIIVDSAPASMDDVRQCKEAQSLAKNSQEHILDARACPNVNPYRDFALEHREVLSYVPEEFVRYLGEMGVKYNNPTLKKLEDINLVHINKQLNMIDNFLEKATPSEIPIAYIAGNYDPIIDTDSAIKKWRTLTPNFTPYPIDAQHAQCSYTTEIEDCDPILRSMHVRFNTPSVDMRIEQQQKYIRRNGVIIT